MEDLDRERATGDSECRSIAIEIGEFLGIHRGGRDDQFEVSSS